MVIFQDNSLSKIPQPSQYKSNKNSSKDLNNNMLPSRSFTRHNVTDALKPYFPSQKNCSKLFTTLPKYVNPLLKKNMTLSLCDEVSHEKLKKPILIKSTSVTSKIEMLNGTDNSIPIKSLSQTENATLLYNSSIVTMRQPNIVKDKTLNHNSNEKATLHTPNFYFLSLDKRHHLSSQTKHSPFIRNGSNRSSNNSFSFYIPMENNYDRLIDQNISHTTSSTLHSKPLNPSNSFVFCSKPQLENEPNHNVVVDNKQALNLKSQNIAFLLDDSNHMIDIKTNNNDINVSNNLHVSHMTPSKYKNTLEQSKVKINSSTHLRNSIPGPRGCNNSPSFIYTDFKSNKPRSYYNKTNSNSISYQTNPAPNISAKNNIFLHDYSTISSPQNVKPFNNNNQCQQIPKTKSFIQKQSNTQMTMSQNFSDQNGNSLAYTPTNSFNTTPANTDSLSQERNFTITKSSTIISQIKPPSNKRSIIPQLNTFTLPQSVSHDINSSSLKLVKLKSNNSIDTEQKINPDTISNSIVIKNPKNDHSEKGSYHQVHEKLQNVFQKSLSVDTANQLENTFKDLNCCCIDANNAKHNGSLQHNQCETVSSERIQEGNCSNDKATLLNKNGSYEKFSHKNNINIVNDKVSICDLEVPFLHNDGNSNNNNKIPATFKNQSSINNNNKCDPVELLTYQLHTLYEKYMNVMEENRKLVELLKEQLKTNVVACHHFIPLKVPENFEYPLDKNHPDNIYNIIHKLNIKPPPNMTEQMEQNIQTDLDNLEDQEVEDMANNEDDFLTSAQYAQDGYFYNHHHRPQNNQIYHINSLEDIRIMENHSIATQ